MPKIIRLTRTMVVEYEPNPDDYPYGYTIEQMAEKDADHDDREMMFDECVSDEVIWEVVEVKE